MVPLPPKVLERHVAEGYAALAAAEQTLASHAKKTGLTLNQNVDWRLEQEQIFQEQRAMADEQKCSVPQSQLPPEPPKDEPKKDMAAAAGLLSVLGTLFTKLNVKAWPLWAKCVAFLVVVPVLALVYKQQRIDKEGIPLFTEYPGLVWFDDGSPLGKIQYPNGNSESRVGLAVFVVTWEEYQKVPEVLGGFGIQFNKNDFPVVVFCNSSAFDATAVPIMVRCLADGRQIVQKPFVPPLVRLLVPRDGGYRVYFADGSKLDLDEREWVEKYMNLPFQAPSPAEAPKAEAPKVFTPEKK